MTAMNSEALQLLVEGPPPSLEATDLGIPGHVENLRVKEAKQRYMQQWQVQGSKTWRRRNVIIELNKENWKKCENLHI